MQGRILRSPRFVGSSPSQEPDDIPRTLGSNEENPSLHGPRQVWNEHQTVGRQRSRRSHNQSYDIEIQGKDGGAASNQQASHQARYNDQILISPIRCETLSRKDILLENDGRLEYKQFGHSTDPEDPNANNRPLRRPPEGYSRHIKRRIRVSQIFGSRHPISTLGKGIQLLYSPLKIIHMENRGRKGGGDTGNPKFAK